MRFEGLSPLGLHLASFAPTLEAIAYIDHGFSFLPIPSVLNIWSRTQYMVARRDRVIMITQASCDEKCMTPEGRRQTAQSRLQSMIGSHLNDSLLT
jgi:hypothetical protein